MRLRERQSGFYVRLELTDLLVDYLQCRIIHDPPTIVPAHVTETSNLVHYAFHLSHQDLRSVHDGPVDSAGD